ncbi:hypothetical protein QE152_g2009 [Popillia japonica]|uniref:Uncharacterized protein n=1 Tax=Popillia japonica TaxID=7064 RepID=A0AAW1N4B5_POPJA
MPYSCDAVGPAMVDRSVWITRFGPPFSPSESEYGPSDIKDEDEQCNLADVDDSDEISTDEEEEELVEADASPAIASVLWKEPHVTFRSRLTAPDERKGVLTLDANRSAREIDIFLTTDSSR